MVFCFDDIPKWPTHPQTIWTHANNWNHRTPTRLRLVGSVFLTVIYDRKSVRGSGRAFKLDSPTTFPKRPNCQSESAASVSAVWLPNSTYSNGRGRCPYYIHATLSLYNIPRSSDISNSIFIANRSLGKEQRLCDEWFSWLFPLARRKLPFII